MQRTTGEAWQRLLFRDRLPVWLACAVAGLYGWLVFASTFSHPGSIGLNYNAPGTDWMVFYLAAKRTLAGDLAGLYDGAAFTAQLNTVFADRLTQTVEFRPWLYPPHFLLVLAPFGLLSFNLAYLVFVLISFAAMSVAAAGLLYGSWERRLVGPVLLISPAASITVALGQNTFLTVALLLGGFGLRSRHPVLAGAMLGVLTYKPQFWPLVTVALVAARDWKTLASAAAAAALLIVVSIIVFGTGPWLDWMRLAIAPPPEFTKAFHYTNRLWGISVFTCVMLIGFPQTAADVAQAIVAVVAALVVYAGFRRLPDEPSRVALLLAMVLLAAPHAAFYELLLPLVAVYLVIATAPETLNRPATIAIMLATWLSPLLNPPILTPTGLATPALVGAVGGLAWWRAPAAPSRRAAP